MIMVFADSSSEFSWGSVADWIAAVGTIAAFLIAAVTYLRSYLDSKTAQARRISIRDSITRWGLPGDRMPNPSYVSGVEMQLYHEPGVLPTLNEPFAAVTTAVHNGTDETIGPVRVEVVIEGWEAEGAVSQYEFRALQPGKKHVNSLVFRDNWDPEAPTFLTRITFQDAAGRWWRRTEGGSVARAPKASKFVFAAGTSIRPTPDEFAETVRQHNRRNSD